MANHVNVNHTDAHLADDDHNWYPERTMPQGTQENGVEFQHEERDMNYGGVLRWFASLAVAVAIIFTALAGAFYFLGARTREARQLPSPIFAQQQVPPYPRLIPNPFDTPKGMVPQGPVEYGAAFKARESQAMSKVGLWNDATRQPQLPPSAAAVLQELKSPAPAAGETPGAELYPSDTSGGTMTEDRLR